MRNLVLILAGVAATGCATPSPRAPKSKVIGETPHTMTIAPHAQAKKFRQQEERRVALEDGMTIQGATVVR